MGSGKIADYLNENNYKTAVGDLNWSASKVVRVLRTEKYMGYILLWKWTPIVSEEVWWLANEIRTKRAKEYIYSEKGNIVTGLREPKDIIAQKSFCQCGYTRSIQYVHVATQKKEAQFRYTCRCQINSGSHKEKSVCHVPAVSEVKLWLMSLKVFGYIFGFEAAGYSILFQFMSTKTVSNFHTRYKRVMMQKKKKNKDDGDSKDEILYTINFLKEAQVQTKK